VPVREIAGDRYLASNAADEHDATVLLDGKVEGI